MPSICMYVLISCEQLNGFYSCLAFRGSTTIGQCLVDMSILSSKFGAPPKNGYFLKNGYSDLDYISAIYGEHNPK